MNILQINRNFMDGGAAIAAQRLHNALNKSEDWSSSFMCRHGGSIYGDNVYQLYPNYYGRMKSVLIDRVERIGGYQYLFQKNFNKIKELDIFKRADVVHFHITHGGYINQHFVADVAKIKPVIWTFHDMWALTGRCAHSYGCEKWRHGCGDCPNKKSYPSQWIDRSEMLWKLKKEIYSDISVHVVSPSRWLQSKIEASMVAHWDTTVISNSADLDIFSCQKDRQNQLKDKHNLPLDKKIFLFVAHGGINNAYKGFDIFREQLTKQKDATKQAYLLIVGGKEEGLLSFNGVGGKSLGIVRDETKLSEIYGVADYFVLPSSQENLPLTIIESMACGTPSIAFNVGGIPEMIQHEKTGFLADIGNKDSLGEMLNRAINMQADKYSKMSRRCRVYAEENFSIESFVNSHIEIYKSLV